MDKTYERLVDGQEVFRYRGWDEGDEVVSLHKIRHIGEWSVTEGVLVVEDPANDIVCRFERTGTVIAIDLYERMVRESMGRRRMHDDRCRLRYRVHVRKRDLKIKVLEDSMEEEASSRRSTLESLEDYAYLLEDGEADELRRSLDESELSEHAKERDRTIRRCVRMIEAMNRVLGDSDASETRELVHKMLPFSPAPVRPNCRLTSIRKSYLRRVRRKGSA